MRFTIITPTIGRDTLKRCLLTMRHQVFKDYVHIVVGDGPQESRVRTLCEEFGCQYYETDVKENGYGAAPRNLALSLLDSGVYQSDYVLFLDDDNVLLEPALYNIHHTAADNGNPPLLWQDILFTNKYKTEYYILPKSGDPMQNGDWDNLNCVYRTDILNGLRFNPTYVNDFVIAQQASERANCGWKKVAGIGGVHFLSWDTY